MHIGQKLRASRLHLASTLIIAHSRLLSGGNKKVKHVRQLALALRRWRGLLPGGVACATAAAAAAAVPIGPAAAAAPAGPVAAG